MHSGSNNGHVGLVSNSELRRVFLPEILDLYIERGYAVRKLPRCNGAVVDLETVLQTLPQVTALSVGYEYLALPPNLFETDDADVQMQTPQQIPQYRSVEFDAHNFIVTATGIVVMEAYTRKRVTLNFFEYHEAIGKWLPPLAAVPLGRAGGR